MSLQLAKTLNNAAVATYWIISDIQMNSINSILSISGYVDSGSQESGFVSLITVQISSNLNGYSTLSGDNALSAFYTAASNDPYFSGAIIIGDGK